GMAVSGDGLIADWSGIDYQPDLVHGLEVAAEDVIAAVGEGTPDRQLGLGGIEQLERGIGVLTEKPARLVVKRARLRLEITPAKEDRGGREQRAVSAVPIVLGEPYDESVVGIAE